jgi:uncharacterized protein with von Willebrand factor type A (vWA) domain
MIQYIYSRWDGSQRLTQLDEEAILDALSDDLMDHGNLRIALRQLLRRGLQTSDGDTIPGFNDLMQQLRQRRQDILDRDDLDSVMRGLQEKLEEIVETERVAIENRIDQAQQTIAGSSENKKTELQEFMDLLESRMEANRNALETLPDGTAEKISQLQDYDFVSQEARSKFEELLKELRDYGQETLFNQVKQQVSAPDQEQMKRFNDMLKDLNQLLRDGLHGGGPDIAGFTEKYPEFFGENPPNDLETLLQSLSQNFSAGQALMNSLSGDQRSELQLAIDAAMGTEIANNLSELAALMDGYVPPSQNYKGYNFTGNEEMNLNQALGTISELQRMEQLEQQMSRALREADMSKIDREELADLLGDEANQALETMERIAASLRTAGYLEGDDDDLKLTAKATRRLGYKALEEVFGSVKNSRIHGGHQVAKLGPGSIGSGVTRRYEFGDDLTHLDLRATVRNAVLRAGQGVPVKMSVEDFEIELTEIQTQVSTVLLLDQSRSMGMWGTFTGAKKVVMALSALLQSQFPQDKLHVVGFSDFARVLPVQTLSKTTWNDYVSGTNMHHALILGRELLAKDHAANKQIMMITDGEPTCYIENGYSNFSYPPSKKTIEETLKEVKRCTQAGITINTFMLETTSYLLKFVEEMMKLNKGRAFYSSLDQLGHYVLVDYLRNKTQSIAG